MPYAGRPGAAGMAGDPLGPLGIDLTVTADDAGWAAAGSYAASVNREERERWPLRVKLRGHAAARTRASQGPGGGRGRGG